MAQIDGALRIDAGEIPGYPSPRVAGHAGELVFGTLAGAPVCVQSGRKHLYENEGVGPVIFGVLCLARLGAQTLVLTNAAGTAHAEWTLGDLMLVQDHLDSSFHAFTSEIPNLVKECGIPVRTDIPGFYSPRLMEAIRCAAHRAEIEIREGVYCFTPGPFFETVAEVKALSSLGADAFGMSTVPEAVAGALAGLEVAALSGITNYATGIAAHPHSHQFVTETAGRIVPRMSHLLTELLKEIAHECR
jgi:purine-nucleoside phosphorylase